MEGRKGKDREKIEGIQSESWLELCFHQKIDRQIKIELSCRQSFRATL